MEEQELMCAAERLQNAWEETARNIRDKFRLCLHEGGHALFMRPYGDVQYHGPYIRHDGQPVLGAVSPKGDAEPGPIAEAASYIAGPLLVHLITGTPDNQVRWEESHDVQDLQKRLEDHDIDYLKMMGESVVLDDTLKPDFLSRLEVEVRAYEREIFHTDECWQWGWTEYCLHWFLERVAVGSNTLGYVMWLIPDGGEVRLFLHGEERQAGERIHRIPLEVYALDGGEHEAVRRWNEQVRVKHEQTVRQSNP